MEITDQIVRRDKILEYGSNLDYWRKYGIVQLPNWCKTITKWNTKKNKEVKLRDGEAFAMLTHDKRIKIYQPNNSRYKYSWIKGKAEGALFGAEPDPNKVAIFCEGPKDTLVLQNLMGGEYCVIGRDNAMAMHIPNPVKISKVRYVVGDNDDTGRKGAEEFANKYKCRIIKLPDENEINDVADYVEQGYTQEDFIQLIEDADTQKDELVDYEVVNDSHSFKKNDIKNQEVLRLSDDDIGFKIWRLTIPANRKRQPTVRLYYEGIYDVLGKHGFYKREIGSSFVLIREIDNIIEEVSPHQVLDFLSKYVDDMSLEIRINDYILMRTNLKDILNRNRSLLFGQPFMAGLKTHDKPILRDTRDIMYIPFRNGIQVLQRDGKKRMIPYSVINDACIWKSRIIDHDFIYSDDYTKSHFYIFLWNVSDQEKNQMTVILSAIGYIIHDFNDPANTKMVVFLDKELKDLDNASGGTGKTLIIQGIDQVRDVVILDGKEFKPDKSFLFQNVTLSTQLLCVDDIRMDKSTAANEFLYSKVTGGMAIERKYRDQIIIPAEDSPKIAITTNYSVKMEGSSSIRRTLLVELGDHYSKHIVNGHEEPIKSEHKCTFFSDDWNQDEWNRFYSTMISCAELYFATGVTPPNMDNFKQNRLRTLTSEEFAEYITTEGVIIPEIPLKYDDLKSEFITNYPEHSDISAHIFTKHLNKYASMFGYTINSGKGGSDYNRFKTLTFHKKE